MRITSDASNPASVRVAFDVQTSNTARLCWRLNHEPWQWTEKRELFLDGLPSGEYTVRAAELESDLQGGVPVAPVETVFRVEGELKMHLPALIGLLNHPDYDRRKAAIRAFQRYPAEKLLPALEAARAAADDDARWWIDAAIQASKTPKAAQ